MNPYPQVVHILTLPIIVLGAFLFLYAPAHGATLQSQTDSSTVNSAFCNGPGGCGGFNGGKTHVESLTATSDWSVVSSASTLYVSLYAGMDGASWGSFVDANGPQVAVNFTDGSACSFVGTFGATSRETFIETTLSDPLLFTNIQLAYSTGDCDTITTGDTFNLVLGGGSTNWNGEMASRTDGSSNMYYVIGNTPFVSDLSCLEGDFGTCINTVDPEHLQVIATSSLPYTFAVDGYINASDYEEGARVMIKVDRNTDQQAQGALLAWDSAFGNKTYIDIPASGTFDVSTSSEAISANLQFPMDRVGLYRVRWEVQSPKISVLGFSLTYSTLESLNTRFTIGTSTPLDKIQIDGEDYLQSVVDSIEGDPLDQCNFNFFDSAFDFRLGSDLLGCIGGMLHWFFVLPPGVLENTIVQLKEGFLTRVPWGYFTRVVTAVQGGAPGTLPTVHADIPISATEDISIEFDIDDMVSGAANLTDTMEAPNGQTARQILEPIIQLIVGLLVLMFIWKDILRSAH